LHKSPPQAERKVPLRYAAGCALEDLAGSFEEIGLYTEANFCLKSKSFKGSGLQKRLSNFQFGQTQKLTPRVSAKIRRGVLLFPSFQKLQLQTI
jgi:hypothetical protein